MQSTPYYAPTYFCPTYFYSAIVSNSVPTTNSGATPYDAPSYFAQSYFYLGTPAAITVPVCVGGQGRDQAAYEALVNLIQATGVFEEVIFGTERQRNQAGSDSYPLVLITPRGWEESDDYDPVSIVRTVSFGIRIVVRTQDGSPQFDQLDRLSSTLLNIVDRSDLDGSCLPPLTRIRAGRYETSEHYPEQSVILDGEFTTIVDPLAIVFTSC